MYRDIEHWNGRPGSKDRRGWYVTFRERVNGNIIDVSGPFKTRDEAEDAELAN